MLNIVENGMQNKVIILGKKENPYSYIEQCDWYIQPSRFEGKAVTVREAQALHKRGYRTEGGAAPLRETTAAVLLQEMREHLINNTYREDYSNKEEIKKLYALIGEK